MSIVSQRSTARPDARARDPRRRRRLHRALSRRPVVAAFALALISLGAAWLPATEPSAATVAPANSSRFADLAGVYVLSRATGARPPIPFSMSMAGGTVAGTVDGARLILASDGSYTNDVVVRWTKTPPLPIPGLEADGEPHTLQGSGRYTADGDKIVIRPGDMFSRGVVSAIRATVADSVLDLRSASGGLAGSNTRLDAHFVRVRSGS